MAGEKKYSYIKYPYSKSGWVSIALAGISLTVTVVILVLSVLHNGGTTMFLAACGFTALVMSIMGLWFAFLAIGEKEKNYLFAFIGGGLSLVLSIVWVMIVIGGTKTA